jgi:hypothetical protein
METLGEHGPAATECSIHRARDAGTQSHHPTGESAGVRRLDHEVRVRGLQRVMDKAKIAALPYGSEATLEQSHEPDCPKRRQAGAELHGHVRGTACSDAFAPSVRNGGVRPALPSRAAASAAPSAAVSKMKTELDAGVVHDQLD